MSKSLKQFGLDAMGSDDPTPLACMAMRIAALIEPLYATMMRIRNWCYDRGIFRTHQLGRFTISVGNITTGGTGKTPVVMWIADQLRSRGRHPAILLRGYGSKPGQPSDEATLLDHALNGATEIKIPVKANPSRIEGAAAVLAEFPQVNLFLLDDGFQHRRAARDFNLVLISASFPFGFGRVLPRGLLREPISGLARADAFVITRCSAVSPQELTRIDGYLERQHPTNPVFHADHLIDQVWISDTRQSMPITSMTSRRMFTVVGIGDPVSFFKQIEAVGCDITPGIFFDDHHPFTHSDVMDMIQGAREAGCDSILTTEKDWVKIERVVRGIPNSLPFVVAKLNIKFRGDEGEKLIAFVLDR